jgi:hypothetical protein
MEIECGEGKVGEACFRSNEWQAVQLVMQQGCGFGNWELRKAEIGPEQGASERGRDAAWKVSGM